MVNLKVNQARPDTCGKKARKPRLPWVGWAWVVHGFLFAGIAIYTIVWFTWFRGIVGENLTFFEFLKTHIATFVSILFFLAVSTALIVKPHLGGIVVFLGKVFGIIAAVVKGIIFMFSGELVEMIQPLKENLMHIPKDERTGVLVIGIIITLALLIFLILFYVLICLGLGYLVYRLVNLRKHGSKSKENPYTA